MDTTIGMHDQSLVETLWLGLAELNPQGPDGETITGESEIWLVIEQWPTRLTVFNPVTKVVADVDEEEFCSAYRITTEAAAQLLQAAL